ncbi:unnamed protein product [Tilletia controversa]|uniref:IPT/TIG domain-containing protein n=1 Tax=Tilletia controversa TaxID=13291 RepID=A0A8X7MVD1_9BASI|nr:hypothetical protein CF328_g3793 [Tilletia controversa]KAE8248678.1 hypothetical protein A4X06_0g3574 [Tilletia controversa]CAD6926787.1 unnamed protein product [Tilletia controversa]CAD6950214.1 unnamed protein product [Tilletia controversa]CAD6955287.1 unnamed protein product [Tilletia controversa]
MLATAVMSTLFFTHDQDSQAAQQLLQQQQQQQQQQSWGSRFSSRPAHHNTINGGHSTSPIAQRSSSAGQSNSSSSSSGSSNTAIVEAIPGSKSTLEDEIFNQMISDTSFDPPSNQVSDHESPLAAMNIPSNNPHMFMPPLSVDVFQGRFDPSSTSSGPNAPNTAPSGAPFSAAPSAFSSRRGSFESAGVRRDIDTDPNESAHQGRDRSASSAGGPHTRISQAIVLRSFGGSAQNAITDAEIGFSSHAVCQPALDELKDLQIHVHGIQMQGHKSRVETQIRMRIELVRPAPEAKAGAPTTSKFQRIGSFTHLKLPPLSGTKRNSKKYQRNDIDPQKILYFDATVVNATPPHDRIFVCSGCMQRERKRLHRKKRDLQHAGAAVPATLDGEDVGMVVPPSKEEVRNMGFDPSLPGAEERALQQMLKDDRKRVVVFNCGDYVDFHEGETILPTRITCYCRHHRAKIGFCIIFTMRDWQGRLLATGSTPPIMITDDHKTQGSSSKANGGTTGNNSTVASPIASSGIRAGHSRVGSADSGDEDDDGPSQWQSSPHNGRTQAVRNTTAGVVKGVQKKAKKERRKPYDDGGARRRTNTSGGASGLVMTPFAAENGHNSSPAESSSVTSPSNQDTSSVPAATPQQLMSNSPANFPTEIVDAGSLSPSNLLTNPQSLPDFSLEFFLQQQGLQLNGGSGLPTAFSWPQLGTADLSDQAINDQMLTNVQFNVGLPMGPMPGGPDVSMLCPPEVPSQPQSMFGPIPPAQTSGEGPIGPQISKLIPGEGPTCGGIEVTILGENFEEGITCVFGDVPATNTRVWAANTLVCVLPPSQSPGPVIVTLKGSLFGPPLPTFRNQLDRPLPLFTYVESSDRALMELALQVVGLQMTGAVQSARDVAMRVVGSGHSFGAGSSGQTQYSGGAGGHGGTQHTIQAVTTQSRDAISGLISSGSRGRDANAQSSFQDSVLNFLSILDADVSDVPGANPRRDAIRLANKQGHTLLHLAVMLGFHRLAANVLRRGAPVNARDRNGYTALHFAALHGRVTIARLLLGGGARDNIPNWEGQLPIDIAREKDQIDVEMMLADTGTPAAEVHLSASQHDSGVSISERDDETATDRGLEDVEESDEASTESTLSESGDSPFGEDSVFYADDERELSNSNLSGAFAGTTDSDDASASGSVDSGRTARRAVRAMADPALALRAFLARAGDSVAAMEWAQRLQVPGRMDALQARLAMLNFNMPSLPVWPLARPTPHGDEGQAQGDESSAAPRGPACANASSGIGNIADWANTLFSAPPPTYEDALASEDRKLAASLSDADGKTAFAEYEGQGEGTSASTHAGAFGTQQAGGSTTATVLYEGQGASQQGTAGEAQDDDVEGEWHEQMASTGRSPSATSSKLLPATDPFRARPSRSNASLATSNFTNSMRRRAVALTHRRPRRSIYDDAMLFWFWIPALVAVLVLVFLSSGDGVLSFRDLLSYFDLGGPSSGAALKAGGAATSSSATDSARQVVASIVEGTALGTEVAV